ncbi:TIGR00366 family protein [Helicobacter sp. 11S03491-1]|uniref:TIGR00366 family protein n=1 Tax=Helicobacter sp. 11S03491-1 TaxID=1476196 RepID=UPI000BA64577|nr:TIGR00366 family protein [Helicobacter sp. 11S03491-1]PAF42551.1 TIGR00366 family protein [Helicobacter sp. 11S03491-1]
MISRISSFMTMVVNRFLPDPLIFAILLTILVFGLGVFFTPSTPLDMIKMWGDGFWNLLAFGMQMALVLVAGSALASAPLIKGFLKSISMIAKTPTQGVMLVTFVASIACSINWGFGLVVGAMFAKEVAKNVKGSHYPLLIASAYIGFLTWGGGLSGSIPLMAATPGNPIENTLGLISLKDTIFSHYNIFVITALIIIMPFATRLMSPKNPKDAHCINPSLITEESNFQKEVSPNDPPALRLEESKILNFIIVIIGFIYLVSYLYSTHFNITINTVNMILILAGLFLHKTPMAYMRAISYATKSCASILIQFPFYASIQLMIEHSGLGLMITQFFIEVSNKHTFAIMTFFSSALVNFAVPSGGGHWIIQAPFVMPAAQTIGADLGKAVMAISYGEQWMNMAQPFWALPALAIAGLGVRDIMGYCITALLISCPIFIIGLIL